MVAFGAVAAVATFLVDALCSICAQLSATFLALVDINTTAIRLRLVALGAGAVAYTASYRNTFSSAGAWLSTGAAGQHAAVAEQLVWSLALAFRAAANFAHNKWIAGVSLRTATLVAARQIFTQCI